MFEQHLLSIEDEPEVANLIWRVAREAGFYPHIATQAHEIAPLYRQVRPQVILLDVLMPDMDGFDVIQFLHQEACDAWIVFLSGSAEYRDMAAQVAEAYHLKVLAVLSKPFRVTELRLALQEVRQQILAEEQETASQGNGAA